jgi:hypothetical protein
VTQLNPAVSPGFAAIVRKLMAKKPEERYPSAAALRDELLIWAAGEKALPLDRPEDKAYQEAVAQLEAEDPPEGESAEGIPVAIPAAEIPLAIPLGPPRAIPVLESPTRHQGPTTSVIVAGQAAPPPAPTPKRLLYIAIGVAVLCLFGCLGFVGLLSLLGRH